MIINSELWRNLENEKPPSERGDYWKWCIKEGGEKMEGESESVEKGRVMRELWSLTAAWRCRPCRTHPWRPEVTSVYKLPILIQWKEKNWTWQISEGCNSDLCPDRQICHCLCIPACCTSDHDRVQGLQPEAPPHGFSIISWWCSGEQRCLAAVWSNSSSMPNLSILARIRSHPFLPPLPDVWEALALSLRFQESSGDTAKIFIHGSWPLFSNGGCLSNTSQPAWWLKQWRMQ